MKRNTAILLLFAVLVGVNACDSGGGSVTTQALGEKMMNALFEERWDDAQALALPEFAEEVAKDLEKFKAFYEKYDFREIQLGELSRPGTGLDTGDQESNRELDVNFQYRVKGTDRWRSGVFNLRALATSEGLWGISAIKLYIPSR